MRSRPRVRALLAAAAPAPAGLTAVAQPPVQAAAASPTATAMPTRVFAPYFEAYTGDDPAAIAQQSGAKYLSMAFLQTPSSGSCAVDWNGSTSQPVGSTFASSIATIRSRGGDVIPSFGGYTADTTGTEIADSCTSVSSIATAIENVITAYDLSRIDFDVEEKSLTNSAGIDRRNKAIAQVESWAAAHARPLQVSYTLPTNPTGLDSGGLAVVKNAAADNARIDVVNIMTFDYYVGTNQQMAADTESAASGLVSQLGSIYPAKTTAQRWAMVGVTEMPGIDDYGAGETFTTADAVTVYNWAVSKGINEISMWASQRDNGGCPGTGGSDSCSGISQTQWYFSHTWEPFTTSSSGGCTAAQLLADPGFESGANPAAWTQSSTLGFAPITNASGENPHSGTWKAWFDGNGTADTDTVAQSVTIPSTCTAATLSFWLHTDTTENTTTAKPDTFTVQVLDSAGTVLATLATFSNLDHNTGYAQHSYSLSAYAGKSLTVKFTGKETDKNGGTTNFVLDDTALSVQ